MRPPPFVDHGARRIGAHPRRAEQMPTTPGYRVVDADVGSTRGFENLAAARQSMLHHLSAVLTERVIDLRRGDAVAVLQHGIEGDAVVLLGQILADRRDPEAMTVEPAEDAVMIRAPRQNAFLLARHRFEHRPRTAAELDAVAAHKAARQIGVVKLLAPEA